LIPWGNATSPSRRSDTAGPFSTLTNLGCVADWTAITGITGIVVSGVIGPSVAALWAVKRQEREAASCSYVKKVMGVGVLVRGWAVGVGARCGG
jgi:hypothetical protein